MLHFLLKWGEIYIQSNKQILRVKFMSSEKWGRKRPALLVRVQKVTKGGALTILLLQNIREDCDCRDNTEEQ